MQRPRTTGSVETGAEGTDYKYALLGATTYRHTYPSHHDAARASGLHRSRRGESRRRENPVAERTHTLTAAVANI